MLSAVVQRLRNGVPKDQMLPPFDPRSAVLYALLAFEVVLTFVVVRAMGFTFSPKLFHMIPAPVVFAALISGPLIRRLGHPRMGGLIETWALLGVQSLAAIFLLIPLTSISAPMADATLSRADALLGFHCCRSPPRCAITRGSSMLWRRSIGHSSGSRRLCCYCCGPGTRDSVPGL